jgi:hypothetical protein
MLIYYRLNRCLVIVFCLNACLIIFRFGVFNALDHQQETNA